MTIKTILFDFDGTIGNTNQLIYDSFLYTFKKYNINVTHEKILEGFGPTLEETFKKYSSDDLVVKEMISVYREFNIAAHDEYVKPFPHVVEVIKELYNRGITMGVVTSKKTDLATHGVKMIGVYDYIDVIIGADEVKKAKPDPEGIYLALKSLGKNTALLVGDNASDILSAKNAKCLSCGVLWSVKPDELRKSNPDYLISDFNELLNIVGE